MKHRKDFYLDDSTIAFVEKFQDENHCSSFTEAIEKVIQAYKGRNDVKVSKALIEKLARQIAKELEAPLSRIRLGVNNADRNNVIVLSLLSQCFDMVQNNSGQLQKVLQLLEGEDET